MKFIEDVNPWGLLWEIIVENIPLFHDQFFELFSAQVLTQTCAWIVLDAKIVLFNVIIVIDVTIIILQSLGSVAQSLNVLLLYGNMEQLA